MPAQMDVIANGLGSLLHVKLPEYSAVIGMPSKRIGSDLAARRGTVLGRSSEVQSGFFTDGGFLKAVFR